MKIRVLVVDDSALMRKMVPRILGSDPAIEVIATAMDGTFALKKIRELKPDVVTLDIDMPRMDGIETLQRIMAESRTPTVMVSSLSREDAALTFLALEMGAFDYVAKPRDALSVHIDEIARDLIEKVKAAAGSRPERTRALPVAGHDLPAPKKCAGPQRSADAVLAIGISTGGPNALGFLLPLLHRDLSAAILIVQHMPEGFTSMFADRLNKLCRIEVKEASDGDLVLPGRALIARGDRHLKVKRMPLGTIAVLSDAPPVNGHRPSADVLFRSVAAEYGDQAAGLIMTGMGVDGAEGIGEIRARGGITLAQDQASCVVFGMPKAAMERGHITDIVPLEGMGEHLNALFRAGENRYAAGA